MKQHEEIAKAAYELWEKSGRATGKDLEHWLEAERTVMERRKQACAKEKSSDDTEKKPKRSSKKGMMKQGRMRGMERVP